MLACCLRNMAGKDLQLACCRIVCAPFSVYLVIVYLRRPVHRNYEAERRRESYHFEPADSHPFVTVVKVRLARVQARLFRSGNLVFSSRNWDRDRDWGHWKTCSFLPFFSSKTLTRDKWPSLDIELIPGKCPLV